jgi:hypothetical protein
MEREEDFLDIAAISSYNEVCYNRKQEVVGINGMEENTNY